MCVYVKGFQFVHAFSLFDRVGVGGETEGFKLLLVSFMYLFSTYSQDTVYDLKFNLEISLLLSYSN